MTATLRIGDLRAAVTRILDASERQFGPEINLESLPYEYRREFGLREIFSIDAGSREPGWAICTRIWRRSWILLGRPEDETVIWHDLGHLIGLLQLVAVLDLPPESGPPSR